jgi:hypothetical protein
VSPDPTITWPLFLTFAALTFLAAFLTVSAASWWRVRQTNGRMMQRLAERECAFALVFLIFWLVRLNTVVPIVPVRWTYTVLQDWLWLLYTLLALAVVRARP